MILLLLAAQAAAPVAPAAAPVASTSFSILQPVGNEPCVRKRKDGKAEGEPGDIVVCGKPLVSQKLPYPNEVVLDEPRPSNPDLRGTGALALESSPCASVSGGCGAGLDFFAAGTAAVRLVQKAVAPNSCCEEPGESTNIALLGRDAIKGVGKAFRKKADKSNRVAIPLDDAPPKSVILP